MNINDLPDEVLCDYVFTRLDFKTRASAELTCRRWRALMVHVPQPPIRLYITRGTRNYLEYPIPAYEFGESEYSCWKSYRMDDRKSVSFLKKINRGKELLLEAATEAFLMQCLDAVHEHWTYLVNLQILSRHHEKEVLTAIARHPIAKQVTRLWYPGTVVNNCVLEHLFQSCINLEAISVGAICEEIVTPFDRLPPKLQTLYVPGLYIRGQTAYFLKSHPQQVVEFCPGEVSGSELKEICKVMKNLVTLKITVVEENPECIWPLAQLKSLRNLSIGSWRVNIIFELIDVLSTMPQLKSLEVDSTCVSPAFLRSLVAFNTQLETLGLKARTELDQLVELSRLTTLSVPVDDTNITSVLALIENSSSLRNFSPRCSNEAIGLKVFEALNKKAVANESGQFRLNLGNFPGRGFGMKSRNITIFTF